MNISTRASLLNRIKNVDDQRSWRDFFDIYWRLIYGVAIKAGLTDSEAQDVVQDTIIDVARRIPDFDYRAGRDSFKGWLLQIIRWKIADQFRKRPPLDASEGKGKTKFLEGLPDPARSDLDKIWDEEWEKNLLKNALRRVKSQVSSKHYEVFKLYALDHKPVEEVAKATGVSVAQVYVIKHRVADLLRKEVRRLETKVI